MHVKWISFFQNIMEIGTIGRGGPNLLWVMKALGCLYVLKVSWTLGTCGIQAPLSSAADRPLEVSRTHEITVKTSFY